MKSKIKIYFTDFWPNFDIENNYFTKIISQKYDIIIDAERPDYIIYSVFGTNFLRYSCTRIFFTGENIRPNFKDCDWAFSFDFSSSERHYRLPLYPLFGDIHKLLEPQIEPEKILASKSEFCNFVYSNAGPKLRRKFFFELSKYKKVDSAGRLFNNIDKPLNDKLKFISDYKFTIAFENESYPGYTTEKIFEPMLVNSIPVYYGNPRIAEDFNPKSFINYHDYNSIDALIERVIEVDNDDKLFMEIISEPFFNKNIINDFVKPDNVLKQFIRIFNSNIEPIAIKTFQNLSKFQKISYFKKRDYEFRINAVRDKILNFNIYKIKVKWMKMQDKQRKNNH